MWGQASWFRSNKGVYRSLWWTAALESRNTKQCPQGLLLRKQDAPSWILCCPGKRLSLFITTILGLFMFPLFTFSLQSSHRSNVFELSSSKRTHTHTHTSHMYFTIQNINTSSKTSAHERLNYMHPPLVTQRHADRHTQANVRYTHVNTIIYSTYYT